MQAIEAVLAEGFPPPGVLPRPGKRAAFTEAAARLGIAPHTLRAYFSAAAGTVAHPDWSIYDRWCAEHPLDTSAPVATDVSGILRREVAQRDRLIASLRERLRDHEAQAKEQRLAASLRFDPYEVSTEVHTADSPGFPMTMWSDWHWGETVDAREMGGVNVFNREIAYERVDKLIDGTLKLLRNYSGVNPSFPGVWVCLGGDLISGGIHEELRETNWGTIEEQANEVGGALAGALLRMADEFGEVFVPCVVGNHGRRAFKPVAKRHVRENREWGIYKSLEAQFAGDPRFHFFIPDDVDYHFEVYGHRFLLTHGDTLGVKGGDGIIGAVGPIRRGSVKVGGAEAQIGRNFDTMIIGHWHAYQPRGALVPVITNGTFKGFDEYARTLLRVPYDKPVQALWLVTPKHGIGAQWGVDLS
ncbi:MAG: hypothetical protein KGL39_03375 [Patescibacteria group bacterium]|nr:hypothetical protein [Patescibacteria group bacterium]